MQEPLFYLNCPNLLIKFMNIKSNSGEDFLLMNKNTNNITGLYILYVDGTFKYHLNYSTSYSQ